MVNSNPETVSTDYDTSARLYFEPLSTEDVLAVCEAERPIGVICQFGGQTPLRMARDLEAAGFPVLGTPAASIDLAEDRGKFAELLRELGIPAPEHGEAHDLDEARAIAARIGYPVVVRPSYVLGGRAMEIVYGEDELERFVASAAAAGPDHPVLIDRFLEGAVEIDVDAVCDGTDVFVGAVMEHIEEAGVHSGDSSCQIPPATLSDEELDEVERITRSLRPAARTCAGSSTCSSRARTSGSGCSRRTRARRVPCRSCPRSTGVPLAKVATLGPARPDARRAARRRASVPAEPRHYLHLPYTAVKAAVLPFGRFPGVDTLLGPEMRSTGEVMGIDADPGRALAKALVASGASLPTRGHGLRLRREPRQARRSCIRPSASPTSGSGCSRRGGPPRSSSAPGSRSRGSSKVSEGGRSVVDLIRDAEVDLVVNTPFGRGPRTDGSLIRTAAAQAGHPVHHDAARRARGAPRHRGAARRGRRSRGPSRSSTRRGERRSRCRPGWRSGERPRRGGRREARPRRGPERANASAPTTRSRSSRPRSPSGSAPASSSRSRCPRAARSCCGVTSRSTRPRGAAGGPGRSSSCSTRGGRARAGSPRSRRTSSST